MEGSLEVLCIALVMLFFVLTACCLTLTDKKVFVFHIATLLIGLALIDVYIPTLIWLSFGNEDLAPWLDPFSTRELLLGVVFYTIFYIVMIFTFVAVSHVDKENWIEAFKMDPPLGEWKLIALLICVAFIFLLSLTYEVASFGGIQNWLFLKFTVRFDPTAKERDLLEVFLKLVPWRSMFNTLCFVAFFFRYKLRKPLVYGFFVPSIAVLFAISTSFRGSVLVFLLGLLFVENLRIFTHGKIGISGGFGIGRESIFKIKYVIWSVFILFSFLMYGFFRGIYVNEALGQRHSDMSIIFKVFNQGSGVQGIASIMRRYGEDVEFLFGKTYLDMMLLPIPRVIYTSKPEWYGIDDITTGMGWPESTQSAVTLPGEAYANFGWLGLLLAVVFGLGFGLFVRALNNANGIYMMLYPSILLPVVFVANWMSFTAVMNMFFPTIFTILLLYILKTRFLL